VESVTLSLDGGGVERGQLDGRHGLVGHAPNASDWRQSVRWFSITAASRDGADFSVGSGGDGRGRGGRRLVTVVAAGGLSGGGGGDPILHAAARTVRIFDYTVE
jgi:hypothetical protein